VPPEDVEMLGSRGIGVGSTGPVSEAPLMTGGQKRPAKDSPLVEPGGARPPRRPRQSTEARDHGGKVSKKPKTHVHRLMINEIPEDALGIKVRLQYYHPKFDSDPFTECVAHSYTWTHSYR
jgi:hypothetical protein